ncbi:type II toxin-antitoxin system RelE/ParE family toxin [Piscinibacter terrae]|uniref:Type II toxin-antitoxin system RelE/ParE family toxin n=1 Tax=Piscinibacter terrae TaxID=2496871 RepID=A0A3N7HJF8_9BURK|nr:type II toxin-antitoxin system RelE/ParE family toxin [Albitalea terrae]RQP22200.1 type II toxin-antitoxin system RelE/ParE family toxin [Albitalea terrae]
MSSSVKLTPEANDDLQRLYEYLLQRELDREVPDFSLAERALDAITDGLVVLEKFPFSCRKASDSPFLRELVISFGATGYVALFDIVDDSTVAVIAVRHQREDDYH